MWQQTFPRLNYSSAWESIRDEALAVAQKMHRVPRFHEIMREQTAISANDGRDWRMFILKAYGTEFPHNMAVCPNLAAAVAVSPEDAITALPACYRSVPSSADSQVQPEPPPEHQRKTSCRPRYGGRG